MKILFYRHSLLSRGGDKMVVEHANHLARHGHDVRIRAARVDTIFCLDERVQLVKGTSDRKFATLLGTLLQRQDVDRVVADIIPLAFLLWFRNPGRVIYYAQDYDEAYYASLLQRMLIRGIYLLGLCWLKIPVIAVSEPLAKKFRERFSARVEVATNGIDPGLFFPEPDLDLIARKDGRRAVVILARSDWRKGFDVARQALAQLTTFSGQEIEIWTIGEAPAEKVDGLRHVDFGYIGPERLRQILSSADVLLYPSRHEGFGLLFVEAAACDCPVVTTQAVEIATDRIDALVRPIDDVVGLAEALRELENDPLLREQLTRQGRALAQKYSLERCRERFADLVTRQSAEY